MTPEDFLSLLQGVSEWLSGYESLLYCRDCEFYSGATGMRKHTNALPEIPIVILHHQCAKMPKFHLAKHFRKQETPMILGSVNLMQLTRGRVSIKDYLYPVVL